MSYFFYIKKIIEIHTIKQGEKNKELTLKT